MSLDIGGYKYSTTPLSGGWGVVRYVSESWNPSYLREAWYYLYHCESLCYGIGRANINICTVCNIEIPEHLKGFINLCAY